MDQFPKPTDSSRSDLGLTRRTVRGGAWMFGFQVAERVFSFVQIIVLARVLSPDDFGVMGVAMLAMAALDAFSQTGFELALIQKKGEIRRYLDTAWTIQVLRGCALSGLLFVTAPLVASFFQSPEVVAIIRVVALIPLLRGFSNIGVIYYQKELEFNKHVVFEISGTLANFVVAITVALVWRNVWALAAGLLARHIVRGLASYALHSFRPKFQFDWRKTNEMFQFGRWILAHNIVGYVAYHGDHAVLGKLLGTTSLGLYQVASKFTNITMMEVSRVFSRVTMPALSKLQDDRVRLRVAFLKTVDVVVLLSSPVAAGMLFLGPDFVRLFLGAEWSPMTLAFQILAVAGLVRAILYTGSPLYQAVFKPFIEFLSTLTGTAVMALCLIPLTVQWGLAGTATAVLIGNLAVIPIWLVSYVKISGGSVNSLIVRFLNVLLTFFAVGVPVLLLKRFIQVGILEFVLLAIVAGASYLAWSLLLLKFFQSGPLTSAKEIINSL